MNKGFPCGKRDQHRLSMSNADMVTINHGHDYRFQYSFALSCGLHQPSPNVASSTPPWHLLLSSYGRVDVRARRPSVHGETMHAVT